VGVLLLSCNDEETFLTNERLTTAKNWNTNVGGNLRGPARFIHNKPLKITLDCRLREYTNVDMQRGFTKLFNTIVTSTIWREDDKVRIVWITMLAIADAYGIVNASIPGLAAVANVSLESTEAAIKNLESPDRYSRTKDFEGRRIKSIDGGWQILNYQKYREMLSEEERKEYQAKWIANKRRQKSTVDKSRKKSTLSTQAEAEEEVNTCTRVHVNNWLTKDDLWIELQRILPKPEIDNHIGLWIARIKENPRALYEAIADYKYKHNKSGIKNPAAWITQRYQHFKTQ
jgi:hypothetical protein